MEGGGRARDPGWDCRTTENPPEVHGFDLKVRPVGVKVFPSPIQLHRSDVEQAGDGFDQGWVFTKQV